MATAPIRCSPRMRAQPVLADKGDFAGAVKANSTRSPPTPRSRRRSATWRGCAPAMSWSTTAATGMSRRAVEVLTDETNPLRHSAREALGLSAWKEGKAKDALAFFDQIAGDEAAPRNARDSAPR